MTRARTAYLVVALATLVSTGAGTYLTFMARAPFGSWELTAIGLAVPGALAALVIAWHRPENRIAQVFMATAVVFAAGTVSIGALQTPGADRVAQQVAYAALVLGGGPATLTWVLFILLFPDGHFTRPLWRWAAVAVAVFTGAVAAAQWLLSPPGFSPDEYGVPVPGWLAGPLTPGPAAVPLEHVLSIPALALPALAFVALVDRYRHGSTTVRQQTKWVLYAVAFELLVQVAIFALGRARIEVPAVVVLLATPWTFVAAAIAVLKYRLWEIDRLVVRSVTFGLLWIVSTAALVWLAVVAGLAVGGADRRVYLALAVAVMVTLLVQPLRRRLELSIARLVYGERPRGYGALASLASDVPVGELADLVARTAREGTGAPWAGVWLRVESDGRQLLSLAGLDGAAPALESMPAVVGGEAAALLQALPDPAGASATLVDGAELIGVVVCGRPEGADDQDAQEVVDLVARQSALLLRNARLEEELRQRLQELRDSRQRLVGAQDEERRRLERDLHDGVQQQLVTLVARLRRAAGGRAPGDLEALAAEAEEAVFALQDLARGIYPSVLSDRGLAEALRSHAARVPLGVRVEVEPVLAGARFDRDVEAGLYFVALEALANAQKHAGEATVAIALRAAGKGAGIVLEIHDDGIGFDASRRGPGTGVQNMRDRVAALGGELSIDSAPGSGTWIRASVPLPAPVVRIQAPGKLSRR